MPLARVVTFDGVNSDRVAEMQPPGAVGIGDACRSS